jgi:dihydropteroate synthase
MARRHRDAGASIIDLGGQSSHFENPTVTAAEELARLLPAVELLVADGFVLSIDTWKPEVARRCVGEGVVLVNDTGGMADAEMRAVVKEAGVGAVVMYVEGANPHAVAEVDLSVDKARATATWLASRLGRLEREGITRTLVDPGIAINYRGDYLAYTRLQLSVIRGIEEIRGLGRPVMIPIPRKKEDHRVAAYIGLALEYGADVIRCHDVAMACDLVELFDRTAPAVGGQG